MAGGSPLVHTVSCVLHVRLADKLGGKHKWCHNMVAERRVISQRAHPTLGRCCLVAWWARLGAAVHRSDGEDEFGEGLRDPMPRIDVGAKFVMTAVEILDEGVSGTDYSR